MHSLIAVKLLNCLCPCDVNTCSQFFPDDISIGKKESVDLSVGLMWLMMIIAGN